MVPQQVGGELIEVGPDLLRIRISERSDPIDLPLASVTRLQRSLGKRSAVGKGALKGALIGVGVGIGFLLTAGVISGGCEGGCDASGEFPAWVAVFGAAGGAAGSLVGAAVGATHKTEHWETLPIGQVGVRVVPQRRGAGVALSVRF